MFKKIFPILVISLWAVSGSAEDKVVDAGPVADCPASCPKPAPAPAPCPAPCPAKPDCPKPCPKPASAPSTTPCPKPCPPKPCRAPCPPRPCCTPPPACCWNFNPCNPKGCTDMNCGGLYLSGDFLYWRAENHGFSYAYELQTTVPAGLNVGDVIRVQPSWEPAFRVGAGWNTKYDFWDIFLNYTWYRNHSSETRTSVNGFIPLWPLSDSTVGVFGSVSASSRFTMNMGDLEIGRMVYLTKSLAIRPYWGARGGTLHQKFKDYFSVLLGGDHAQELFSAKNNYWGVGPRAGLSGEWHLDQGFSLLARAAGALLYGKTNVNTLGQTALTAGSSTFTVERQYQDSFYQLVPNMQLALGFQWQTCFWCEKMFFKMSASWETNYWWDQFNLPVGINGFSAPLPTIGNQGLSMEGLTVNVEWDF